jgi:hypothetical protein
MSVRMRPVSASTFSLAPLGEHFLAHQLGLGAGLLDLLGELAGILDPYLALAAELDMPLRPCRARSPCRTSWPTEDVTIATEAGRMERASSSSTR